MNTLDAVVSKAPLDCVRDLRASPTLVVTSDYSGQQKGSTFETYAILIIGSVGWHAWEAARVELRRSFKVGRRRISFKGLGDSCKRRVLPCFLNAADQIPGLCVVLAVNRATPSLFCEEGAMDFSSPALLPYCHYDARVFERLLRVIHFVSFFLAGLSRQGQNVLWYTDQDAIAANDERVVELTGLWAAVFQQYLQHNLRHIRCGTTRCDNGSLQIEDLASVPDLAAGAFSELLNSYAAEGGTPTSRLVVPVPQRLSPKSAHICMWLAYTRARLNRLLYVIEKVPATGGLRVKELHLHALEKL
ncbi:MAG TPA: hypothetical protein VMY42_07965 [Thermoguttaceae bacterium]|nr:hypothetical protein [Thermoguttaceae bacterium]